VADNGTQYDYSYVSVPGSLLHASTRDFCFVLHVMLHVHLWSCVGVFGPMLRDAKGCHSGLVDDLVLIWYMLIS